MEQLTYLLFLKMAHEQTQPPFGRASVIPRDDDGEPLDWPSLFQYEGIALERHYRSILQTLGRQPGVRGVIFRKAQNRIQDPAIAAANNRPD